MAKILVVDNDPHIVRLVQVSLERHGYEVVTAQDGIEALAQIAAGRIDLIITEIEMWKMDGWDLMAALYHEPATRNIPIIVLSPQKADADIFRAWQSGCSAYLSKPFDPAELLTFVEKVLAYAGKPSTSG